MIPLLETSRCAAGAVSNVPPPRFRPLGKVSHVVLQSRDYVRAQGRTAAQEAGLRYEAKVQDYMLEQFPNYMSGPVLSFLDDGLCRVLKPDGFLPFKDSLFIFEIKHHHCAESWWQLEKLYKGVLAKVYHCPISLVEICRTYDPYEPFPIPVTQVSDLQEWTSCSRDDFGVYVWRKKT